MTVPTERLLWRKSSMCGNTTCVEVARGDDEVFVRDSKNPEVVLAFSPQEWEAFLDGAAKGEFRF
jgi:uncharacterized protein DUF397